MIFTGKEFVWLLKQEQLTDTDIAMLSGVSERRVRTIKNTSTVASQRLEVDLGELVVEKITFPCSDDANTQVGRMVQLARARQWTNLQKNYAFSASCSFDKVCSLDIDDKLTATDWGNLLVAYFFKLGMAFSNLSAHVKYRSGLGEVANKLLAALEDHTSPWAHILRYKVAANQVTTAWNQTTVREQRASVEMRELIEKTGYCDAVLAFNKIVPKDVAAPFNALGVASRFKDRSAYGDLWERLQIADKKYSDVLSIDDVDFDDDFADFKLWFAQERVTQNV
ncbi:MAG: hypothetical protein ABJO67_16480 [Pseudoruegeria sp.]